MSEIFTSEICYATTTATDMINAVHDNFATDVNSCFDFFYWIIGIAFVIFAFAFLSGSLNFFFNSVFVIKVRLF